MKNLRTMGLVAAVIIASLAVGNSLYSQTGSRGGADPRAVPPGAEDLSAVLDQNESETRLVEFKDSPDTIKLKLSLLSVINNSRKRYGAAPVKLDILASRVANKQALEAAQDNYYGHWNVEGQTPYQRFAAAGGVDHVTENAAAVSSSGPLDPGNLLYYAIQSHDRFMAERAPNDGHKTNDIDKTHTHVGLGIALVGGQFRYYEEFVDRYFDELSLPGSASPGEALTLVAKPQSGYFLYSLIVYYEPLPHPWTPAQIMSRNHYDDFTDNDVISLWPNRLKADASGTLNLPLKFSKPGSYYVQIYLDTKKPATSGSFTSDGKIQASGLVVLVQ